MGQDIEKVEGLYGLSFGFPPVFPLRFSRFTRSAWLGIADWVFVAEAGIQMVSPKGA